MCDGKDCLTVLDFVGQSNKNYKFADKYRALIGKIKYFENDSGKELNLKNFLEYNNIEINEFYKSNRTFSRLCAMAEVISDFECDNEEVISRRMPNLLSIDSPKLLKFAMEYINNPNIEMNKENIILINMLYYTFYVGTPKKNGFTSIQEGIMKLVENNNFKKEILEILNILFEKINCVPLKNSYDFECPLEVHCTYTQTQILAGVEYYTEEFYGPVLEGVKYFKDKDLDIFFITLNKSDKEFSESTLYEDYAISENLFHWQSQNRDTQKSKNIQRYINSNGRVSLFVIEYRNINGKASPYIYLGECRHVSHQGNKPLSFVWKLNYAIPGKFISEANKNVL